MKKAINQGRNQRPTLYQILLIAKQELLRSFASKSGLFITAIFILIWSWLLFYPIRLSAQAMSSPDNGSVAFTVLSILGLETLKDWFSAELAVYWVVALYAFPAFGLLMSADQMISERKRGGLRFLTLRCSRGQIFFGHFLGHMLIQLCFLIMTLGITYSLLLSNRPGSWFEGLQVLPLLLLNILCVIAPFVALMSLLSVVINSVRMAILVAVVILVLSGVMINSLALDFPFISILMYFIPGEQVAAMAKQSAVMGLFSLWIPVMQSICFLAVGYVVFKRQAI